MSKLDVAVGLFPLSLRQEEQRGHGPLVVSNIDPLDLCGGHIEDDPIALTVELHPSLDILDRMNIREQPRFVHPVFVTTCFEDDSRDSR